MRTVLVVLLFPFAVLAQDLTPAPMAPLPPNATIGQQLFAMIAPILAMVLMGLATAAVAAGKRWFDARAAESVFNRVGAKTMDFALLTVRDIEVHLKPAIEEAAKDGVITTEEGAHLRKMAIDRVKLMLGAKGLAELASALGLVGPDALDLYLGGLVETAVAQVVPPKPSKIQGPPHLPGEPLVPPAGFWTPPVSP